MTEYDFSPEAYEQYIRGQQRIARWVHRTNQTPKADPYQAATPAIDVPREILPPSRIWDTNPPWSAESDDKKKSRKHRTPSEKEFDRERRNDWKYSHREHMDALRASAAHPQVSRERRASHNGTASRPLPLQSRSLHPGLRYPADQRFSDSQDTSSSSEHVYVNPPNTTRKRSSSVQAPIRVPLPGPNSMPLGPLPGPTPYYVYGPEIDAQVELDDEPSGKSFRHSSSRQNKPIRSQTTPHLPPPPASAPVYPSQHYQGHHRYYSSSSPFLHRPQQAPPHQSRPAVAYPYPYAPSPLSPPNSAPAYPYPRSPAGFIPESPKSSERKPAQSEPFIKRIFLNFAGNRKAGETTASKKEGLGSLSQPSSPSPTSPTKSKTWLGSPVKKKLMKTHRKEPSETPRSKSSLDHRPGSSSEEAGTGGDGRGWSRGSLDACRDRERAKEREREGGRDRTREEKKRNERGRADEQTKDRKDRDNRDRERERERERSRRRDQSGSRERHKDRSDRDRDREDRHRTRRRHRERSRSLEERERVRHRDRGRDRTPRLPK
ncbi:hypothetical protein C0995_010322 [Termitomyces sp. Mi166|nr:hypothetical protein C0995_010322 [Termitomyces sp. Mi166\